MKKTYLIGAIFLIATICSCENGKENYIKGVDPYLLSAGFKKFGFKTSTNTSEEYGNLWIIQGNDLYTSYNLSLYSSDNSGIQSIRASAMLTDPNGKIDYSFFHEIAMQTKEECDPNIVSKWLSIHYNNAGDTVINNVSFSVTEPSKLSKMLTIQKVSSESTDNI